LLLCYEKSHNIIVAYAGCHVPGAERKSHGLNAKAFPTNKLPN